MSAKKNIVYKISDISIQDHFLCWENNMIRTAGISQVWIGCLTKKNFPARLFSLLLFLALSGPHLLNIFVMLLLLALLSGLWFFRRPGRAQKQVHIKLISGDIFTFTADDEDSADRFYDALKGDAAVNNSHEEMYDPNEKVLHTQEKKEDTEVSVPTIMEINATNARDAQLIDELKKLYLNYIQKSEAVNEILCLIKNTGLLIQSGDNEGTKDSFKKLVTSGLIGDCNELGLNSLIQEIKNVLY